MFLSNPILLGSENEHVIDAGEENIGQVKIKIPKLHATRLYSCTILSGKI